MEGKAKTEVVRMRIDTATKEQFYKICSDKAINPSALLRQLINNWITEQVDMEIEKKRKTDIK